jgi:hypothetical protein
MIQRVFNTRHAYDCRTECKHDPKDDHGIHCEEWFFTVIDRDYRAALECEVWTPFYPDAVDPKHHIHTLLNEPPFWGISLSFHFGFPTCARDVRGYDPRLDCKYIGTCFSERVGSSTYVKKLVATTFDMSTGWAFQPMLGDERGIHQPPQPKLWAALEQELQSLIVKAEQARRTDGDLKWKLCEKCRGNGLVEV